MDCFDSKKRSEVMKAITSKNTTPEMHVRRLLHGSGLRYGLHCRDLPGRPDVVLRSRRVAVFVHGCFWHQHEGCSRAVLPKSRREYWVGKLEANKERDGKEINSLIELGWRVMVVWECACGVRQSCRLLERMREFILDSSEPYLEIGKMEIRKGIYKA